MPIAQPQAIRTIFFDVGFTLLHPYPSLPEICHHVCQQLHLHIHLDEVRDRMHIAEDYFLRQQRLNRHTWASEEAIKEFWIGYYMNLLRPFVEEHDEARLYQLSQVTLWERSQIGGSHSAPFFAISTSPGTSTACSSQQLHGTQSRRRCCMIWHCNAAMPSPTILSI
jgi:hypothetical protein